MKNTRKALYVTSTVILLFGIVAWSPTPTTDDVIVGTTSVTSPSGQNVIIGTGSSGKTNNSLVVGTGQIISATAPVARYSNIISGAGNMVDATQSLVCGWDNNVQSVDALETRNSCAVGSSNHITSPHACVIGYQNHVSGDWSSAFGTWLNVAHPAVVAVGAYNEPTEAGDAFVVGAGSSDAARRTALRATSDGGLILGSATSGTVVLAKAQGDISMGAYSN